MKTDPVIVIAGSRALEGGLAPRLLVRFLASLPERTTIRLRSPRHGVPGLFEEQTSEVCDLLGLKVEWRAPEFDAHGREATFRRDLEMIDDADLVLAFHLPGAETSGTEALVSKALEADRCAYGFVFDGASTILNGSNDPDDMWGPLLARTL